MAYFMITYDLNKQKNYDKLIDEIERLDGAKAAMSAWFISLTNTTAEVRNHFSGFVDDDDILIVTKFEEKPRYTRMLTAGHDWVNEHFS